jgi:hypothetical protein
MDEAQEIVRESNGEFGLRELPKGEIVIYTEDVHPEGFMRRMITRDLREKFEESEAFIVVSGITVRPAVSDEEYSIKVRPIR